MLLSVGNYVPQHILQDTNNPSKSKLTQVSERDVGTENCRLFMWRHTVKRKQFYPTCHSALSRGLAASLRVLIDWQTDETWACVQEKRFGTCFPGICAVDKEYNNTECMSLASCALFCCNWRAHVYTCICIVINRDRSMHGLECVRVCRR